MVKRYRLSIKMNFMYFILAILFFLLGILFIRTNQDNDSIKQIISCFVLSIIFLIAPFLIYVAADDFYLKISFKKISYEKIYSIEKIWLLIPVTVVRCDSRDRVETIALPSLKNEHELLLLILNKNDKVKIDREICNILSKKYSSSFDKYVL